MKYKRTPATNESVIRIVNALYSDFERREKLLKTKDALPTFNNFGELNRTLLAAVESICEPSIKDAMFFDLCHDLGYDKSALACIMCHKTYYSRKKAVKLEAARRLGLI